MTTFKDRWGKFSLSPSSLKAAVCPFALKMKMEKVPRDEMSAELMRYGIETHAVFDEINKHRGDLNDDVLDSFIEKHTREFSEEVRDNALKYIEKFPLQQVIGSELKIAIDENFNPVSFDSKDAIFRGIIDVVLNDEMEGHCIIVDHKTGWAIYDPYTKTMRSYSWMFNIHYPQYFNIGLGINWTRRGKLSISDKRVDSPRKLTNIGRAIRAQVRRIWNTDVDADPYPGGHCGICSYTSYCPLVIKGTHEIIAETANSETLFAEMIALNKRSKDIREILKERLDKTGSVRILDKSANFENTYKAFGYKETEKISIDPDWILENTDKIQNVKKYLNLNSYGRKKLLKAHPDARVIVKPATRLQEYVDEE